MTEVKIRDIYKKYGTVEVIHGVDIDIADGEFVVLVGPSGCGKSTLLRMIAGLENITAGTIQIGGKVVNNLPPAQRDIAMVFQNYALYPHKTVAANMAFSLQMRKMDKQEIQTRVTRAAEILGLGPYLGPLSPGSVWRSTTAGCNGSRYCPGPPSISVRRALVKSGCKIARTDAQRNS